jgi:demethylmenaquinone methyltransferase / 2-methoxy-6-polyprenyl-1,4-benzoquinol methylase
MAIGSRPAGATDEASAAAAVQQMFNAIAPRYDLLNHVLSASVDRIWWSRTARRFKAILFNPDAQILDICCGTGDMTLALLRYRPRDARPILAADFAHAMLARGAQKFSHQSKAVLAIEADALHLPVPSGSLDLIVTAFGFRNLSNYESGLREFHRALKPGGQLGIMDFSEPGGALGKLYAIYFRRILPALGRFFCGKDGPYNYLPTSVGNFPPPDEMMQLMKTMGFSDVTWTPYTFGIAGLYAGKRD